jgi:hypothetical protein
MKLRFTTATIGFVIIAALPSFLALRGNAQQVSTRATPVRGFVVAHLQQSGVFVAATPTHDVYLPGASVYLRNLSNGRDGPITTTDLSGRFTSSVTEAGRYEVCVVAEGFQDTCRDGQINEHNLLSVKDQPAYISQVYAIPAKQDRTRTTLYGKVSFSDGSQTRSFEPYGDVNSFATISLESNGGVVAKTAVNNYGEYVFGSVPTDTDLQMVTSVGGLKQNRLISKAAALPNGINELSIRLNNRRPTLSPIVAVDASNKQIDIARPGDKITLKLRAQDDDKDGLKYIWVLPQGAGTLSSSSDPKVTWTLPGRNGRYQLRALVNDGRGGYAQQDFSVLVSTGGVPFSGKVIDNAGSVVSGAQVEINGRFVNTGGDGSFSLGVPQADRYILNVHKFGYGVISKILDTGLSGATHVISRSQIYTVDPSAPIKLQHKRTSRDCPPPSASRLPWLKQDDRFAPLLEASFQDGRGHTINAGAVAKGRAAGDKRFLVTPPLGVPLRVAGKTLETRFKLSQECGPGVGVRIPANSLVDANGNLPSGKVQIALSTINLASPEQMPGDYTVLNSAGKISMMESYGAGSIEVMGANGRYNLKAGSSAEFVIPIDPLQRQASTPPSASIPILFYDDKAGLWREEGSATLSGNTYVTKVKHFSTINADHTKTDQSCVAIDSSAIPGITKLEYTLPAKIPGAAPINRTYTFETGAGSEHVLYNLPSNTNITLVPIINGTTVTGDPGEVPAGVFVVNTSGPQNPTNPNRPVGPPYYSENTSGQALGPCSVKAVLTNLSSPNAPDVPNEYLQGLNFYSSNLDEVGAPGSGTRTAFEQGSLNYYAAADPRGLRRDLTSFKQVNGFNDPGAVIVNATFANSGDLGFGRNMNCTKKLADDGATDVACYVTNYGSINTPDQQDANDANNNNTPIATVAMEYSRVENAPGDPILFPDDNRTVKFYVYKVAEPSAVNPGQPNGRVISANLDGVGERPVPQLCVVCHSGHFQQDIATTPPRPAFTTRDDAFMGSRFLPFDLHFYTFPSARGKAAQQGNIRQLNREYVAIAPAPLDPTTDPITELVSKFYPTPTSDQDEAAVVDGWNIAATPASKDFYTRVFARACRTCHISSPFGNADLSFHSAVQFANKIPQVQLRVCDQHVMPHAKRASDIFWQSVNPNQASLLQQYGQANPADGWNPNTVNAQCGLTDLIKGANITASFYHDKIQAIFDNSLGGTVTPCSGCHAVAGGSGGLSLNLTNSYAQIVGVNSGELPSMKRIQPSDHSNSYLWRKIDGSHLTVGGSGTSMPQGFPSLTTRDTDGNGTNDLLEIQQWIDSGAAGP